MHTCTCMRMHAHMHIRIRIRIYAYAYAYTHTHTHIRTCIRTCIRIQVLAAHNPIHPTTDAEIQFTVTVSLLNRLLFAYIVGKVGSLVAALDKQAALVQEKTDQLKGMRAHVCMCARVHVCM